MDNKKEKTSEELAREALLGNEESTVDKFAEEKEDIIQLDENPFQRQEEKPITFIDFIPIAKTKLPSKSLFYDDDMVISIKAANTQEVKNFSSMDEDDPFEIDSSVINILNTCCKIIKHNEKILSYRDISDFDKVFAFFSIRDRTFLANKRESNLMSKIGCSHCGTENSRPISNETFGFYKISDELMKYYSSTEKCFVFSDDLLGSEPLKIYVPTIGITESITSYIKDCEVQKQTGSGGYYNSNDLTILMYTTKDWRSFDDKGQYIKSRLSDITKKWSEDKYILVGEIIKRLKVGIKPNISYPCTSCGKEVSTPVRFRSWRSLLSSESIVSRFFKDTESSDN